MPLESQHTTSASGNNASGPLVLTTKTRHILRYCSRSMRFCTDMYMWVFLPLWLQSHVLVSVIGDAFRASQKEHSVKGGRDLIVEALRHKVQFNTITVDTQHTPESNF